MKNHSVETVTLIWQFAESATCNVND